MRDQAVAFDIVFKLTPTDSTVHAEDVCNHILNLQPSLFRK